MKKTAAGLFRLLLGVCLLAQTAWPAARQDWARLTVEKGLRPGQQVSMEEWNRFLDKLEELSRRLNAVGKWDAESLWKDILVTQGFQPKPVFTEEEWRQIVPRLLAAAPAPQPATSAAEISNAPAVPAEPSSSSPPQTPAAAPRPAAADPKVSLDLRDMEIIEVLKLLSRQYGMNLVVGKNVSGRVTVFLSGVDPWDALRTILETRDLAFVKEGGLVKVMTAPEYERIYGVSFGGKTEVKEVPLRNIRAGSAKTLLDPFKSRVGSLVANELTNTVVLEDTPEQIRKMEQMIQGFDVPLETRVYPLSYGTVEDVLPKIAALAGKDFGSVQADKRSNALLVTAPSSRIDEISKAVEALDVRNKAVLIEAKVLQIILNDSSQWGVNWQYLFSQLSNGSALAGGLAGNFQTLPIESLTRDAAGRVSAKGVTGDLKITQLPHHAEFSSIINFLEGAGKTKMLSAPRIMALNNREASIHVGTKEPIITRNIVNPGSTTTQPIVTEEVKFESVGVKLAVTPSIGNDGYITLKIRPEVSAVESTVNTSNGSSIPIVRLSEAETSVVVKDGVGIVIGGLIEDREVKSDSRVPFLGRIPLIGLPFRSRSKTSQKTELVFFLTPHLTSGDTPAPELEKLRERRAEKQLSSSEGIRP